MEQVDPDIKEYILKCAKEQYVERRDNPLNIFPHSVEPFKIYIEDYEKYKIELDRLKNLTAAEAKEEEIAYRKKQLDDHEKYVVEEKHKVKDLMVLLEKIQKWNCPGSLLELKNFIKKRIGNNIMSRNKHENYILYVDDEITGKEFKEEMIRRYQNIVDGCLESANREQEWANKTNKMLEDLKDNLGDW